MYKLNEDFPINKNTGFRRFLPWIENAVFGLLILWVSRKFSFSFDIRLIYIIVMGLLYGQVHSIFAAVVCLSPELFGLSAQELFGDKSDIKFVETFVTFLFVAVISGFSKSGNRIEMKIIRQSYARLEKLYREARQDLSDARKAALVLAEQIKTSEQSYGKIYNVIKFLENLETNELLERAPEVVKDLTGFDKTALYLVGHDRITLVLCSHLQSLWVMGKTMILDEEITEEVIENGRLYINSQMKKAIPDAIIPIQNRTIGMVQGVIAVWGIPFDKMSGYTRHTLNFTGDLLSDYFTKLMDKDFNLLNSSTGTVV